MITNISVHVLGNNLWCEGVKITRASVDAYTDMLLEALATAFPDAAVEIDAQWRDSGCARSTLVECDGDWQEVRAAEDAIFQIEGKTWIAWQNSPASQLDD